MKKTNKQLAQIFVQHSDGSSDKHIQELADVFISWLRNRGELKRLPDIFRSIDQIWKDKYGFATVTIETAYAIDSSLRKVLEKQVFGAEIRERVVPEIIAGVRLRIDERIIDGSLLGSLEQLKHQLQDAS